MLKYSVNNIISYKELNLKRPAIKRWAGIDATWSNSTSALN